LLELHHFQPLSAFEKLLKRGFLTGDGRRIFPYMKPYYQWMVQQMDKRLGARPAGAGSYPMWAWQLWNGKARPDLRYHGHITPGTAGVLLKLEVPAHLVLLSDFTGWHIPLLNGYHSLSEKEDEEWERISPNMTANERQAAMEKSWENIFDLTRQRDTAWDGVLDSIQAVFWRLDLDMVQSVRHFTARKISPRWPR